jgi:hypothetical protein
MSRTRLTINHDAVPAMLDKGGMESWLGGGGFGGTHMVISQEDLSHLIGRIYDCTLDPARWESALGEIRTLLQCVMGGNLQISALRPPALQRLSLPAIFQFPFWCAGDRFEMCHRPGRPSRMALGSTLSSSAPDVKPQARWTAQPMTADSICLTYKPERTMIGSRPWRRPD